MCNEFVRPLWAVLLAGCLLTPALGAPSQGPRTNTHATSHALRVAPARTPLPSDVAAIRDEILKTHDAHGLPFLILEKERARLHVFDALGVLLGSSPILLGPPLEEVASGPFMARRIPATTVDAQVAPTGRFLAEQGVNLQGEDVVWIDFAAGLAMERLSGSAEAEKRRPRANGPKARGSRIACSCVNVPAGFYDRVVKPSMGLGKAVVYLLPEKAPLAIFQGAPPGSQGWWSTHFHA